MKIFEELESFNEAHKACIDSFVSRAIAKEYEEKIKETKQKLRERIEGVRNKYKNKLKETGFKDVMTDAESACDDIMEVL